MKKVIVAEASPTIKSVADSLLRQNGYDVVCTSDGLQAWEVILAEKPDLVLVGQGLSGISGLELCRQIATDRLTGGIPVVLMIGAKDAVTEEQILASGARGKLRKPFSPKDLLDVAERLAGQTQGIGKAPQMSDKTPQQQTRFNTQVSSTGHLHQKKEPYNLEWLDLKDDGEITNAIPKAASFDISSDETGLVIDMDQYGLSKPQPEPEVPVSAKSPKDEDYEWFLGEIKREMEGKPKFENQIEPESSASSSPSILTAHKPTEGIKFDDIASAEEPQHETINPKPRENSIPAHFPISPKTILPAGIQANSEVASSAGTLSDEQLLLLADRIADRLGAQIAAGIDKAQILAAIRSVFRQ